MQYFNTSLSPNELRLIYRRLAMLNHPDMGGNAEVMKNINIEFNEIKKHIANKISVFENITIGDTITINMSVSKVIAVSRNTFTAQSDYTQRLGVFSKTDGICLNNPKFKASIPKKISHGW